MAYLTLIPAEEATTARSSPPLQRAGQWIVYACFRVVEAVLKHLPLATVFTLGEWGGRLAWSLAPSYRHLVLNNLRIAFARDHDESTLRELGRAHFRRLGANLLCSLKLPTMPLAEIEKRVAIEGIDHVESAIREKHGFVYAICHMGNWEALAQIPAICPNGMPGTLFQPLGNPFLNAHIARLRSRFGFRLFDRHDGFHASAQFLRDGGGLGVLVDQHAGDSGVWCPLFGRLASTTTLGALLTQRTGGPILPLGVLTTGRAQWKIVVRPPVKGKRRDIGGLTAQLNNELENLIRQSPADWFWVHNRWKTPKPNFLLAEYKRGVQFPAGMTADQLQPFEILVRTPNWLGDACMALPAVRALKLGRPDARLTVLTPAKLADFWRAVSEVDHVIEKNADGKNEGILSVRRKIRSSGRHYDVAVLLVESPRSALEVSGCGIPRLVGYRGRWRRRLLDQIVPEPKPGPPRHHSHHFLAIAGHCGAQLDDPRLHRPLRDGPLHRVHPTTSTSPSSDRPPRIGLCAGAEYGPAKRWPVERFAETARAVTASTGATWTLLGARSDAAIGSDLSCLLGDIPHQNLVGHTTLASLIDELSNLDLLLTNDTGTMHLAATLGLRVVAIFGSTEPAWTGPVGAGHTILRHHVPCSPCFHRECPLKSGRYRCFDAITPATAAAAVIAAIDPSHLATIPPTAKDALAPAAPRL